MCNSNHQNNYLPESTSPESTSPESNSPEIELRNKSQVALRDGTFTDVLSKSFLQLCSLSLLKRDSDSNLYLTQLNKVYISNSKTQILTIENPRRPSSSQLSGVSIYHSFVALHEVVLLKKNKAAKKKQREFSNCFEFNAFIIANCFEYSEEERTQKLIENKIQVFLYQHLKECRDKGLQSSFIFSNEDGNSSSNIPACFEFENSNSNSNALPSYDEFLPQIEVKITQYGENRLHLLGHATRQCYGLSYKGSEIVVPGPNLLNTFTDLDVVNSLLDGAQNDHNPVGSYSKHLVLKLFLAMHFLYDLETIINFYQTVNKKLLKPVEVSTISIPSVKYMQTAYWLVFFAVLKEQHFLISDSIVKELGTTEPATLIELPFFLIFLSLIEKLKNLENKLEETITNFGRNKTFQSSQELYEKLNTIFRDLNFYLNLVYPLALLLVKLGQLNPLFLFFSITEGKAPLVYKAETWWQHVPSVWWKNMLVWSLENKGEKPSSEITMGKSVWVHLDAQLKEFSKVINNIFQLFLKFEVILSDHVACENQYQNNQQKNANKTLKSVLLKKNTSEGQCYQEYVKLLTNNFSFLLTDADLLKLKEFLSENSFILTDAEALLFNSKRVEEVNKPDLFTFFIAKMYTQNQKKVQDLEKSYLTVSNRKDLQTLIKISKLSKSAIRLGGVSSKEKVTVDTSVTDSEGSEQSPATKKKKSVQKKSLQKI